MPEVVRSRYTSPAAFAAYAGAILCLTLAVCAVLVTRKLTGTIGNVQALTGHVNEFVTPDLLRNLNNDFETSVGSGQITANSYAEVAKSTAAALDDHVVPVIDKLGRDVHAELATLNATTAALQDFIATTKHRVSDDGGLIPTATASIASVTDVAKKGGLAIESLSSDGHALISGLTPRAEALIDSGHDLVLEATGRVRELQPIEANLAGASADLHRITTDSADKYHSILYPPPVHGFWPHVRQAGEYLIKPIIEGTRIYFQLTALPVRITKPIPAP